MPACLCLSVCLLACLPACLPLAHSTNEDLLNIKRKGDPEVSYPLSYVRYHRYKFYLKLKQKMQDFKIPS
jgi:hypothetical protein